MTPGFLAQIGGAPPLEWTTHLTSASSGPVAVVIPSGTLDGRIGIGRQGPLLAVADLRIDNRDALRAALGVPEERSDLELLLAGFERWGDAVVERLDGPFSYVLWDAREGRASFARDRLGLRPLYRAERAGGVCFGSSLPLIQQAVPHKVDLGAVADHLRGRLDHAAHTLTVGVERVASAHQGTVRVGGREATLSVRRYWSLAPAGERRAISDGEAEVAFRTAFDQAVSACLHGAPGALLSGGLDSSSIVATARDLRPDAALPTFSIVYDDPAADERRYLDAVAAHVGVDPLRVRGENLSLLAGLDDDLRAVGEPFPTPNLFLARSLYEAAGAKGLTAVLDGFAGDNVVGHGDVWLTELAWSLRWVAFAREVRAVARRSNRPRRSAVALIRTYVLAPLASPFRSSGANVHFMRRDLTRTGVPRDPVHLRDGTLHRAELSGPLLPRAFETVYARSAALGVEPRFPFADRALVELCLSLPSRQRVRDGLTRSILRRAMGRRLPDALHTRSGKARLGANFARALFEHDPERLRALVFEDVPDASPYVDVAAVQAAYRLAQTSERERAALALPLWRAVSFARWLSLRGEVSH